MLYFTSDPHWGHTFVSRLRGFHSNPAEHDEALLDNFCSVLKKGDTCYWLGDLAMGNPAYALEMTKKIPGQHHLIVGNHDACFPGHREAYRWQRKYFEVFDSVQAFARRRIEGHEVLLSHFPYSWGEGADHTDEARYTQYRLPDEGRFLIHGHTHNAEQKLHGHQLHVGLDAWGMKPVSLDEVTSWMNLSLSRQMEES